MSIRAAIQAARIGSPRTTPEGRLEQVFRFPADAAIFAGHFPSRPLLPGIVQIEMVRMMVEASLGRRLEVAEIVRAKFSRVIAPDEPIHVEVQVPTREGDDVLASATWRTDPADRPAGQVQLRMRPAE